MQGKRAGLVETDLNASTKKWNKRREQAGLPPVALNEAYGDISAKIMKMADVADVLIIDTAGHDSTEFRTALKVANIVIVPIDPLAQVEADSLQTVTKVVREAQKINPKLAAHVLLYKCQPNTFSERKELRDSLNSHDYWLKPMKSKVSFLRAFVRAMNQGMGVHELKGNVSGAGRAMAQIELLLRGQFGYRKLLYYKGFPGMSTPVFTVSVCSSVKIKGRDCGTINGHDESSSIRTLMKDAREVLVR